MSNYNINDLIGVIGHADTMISELFINQCKVLEKVHNEKTYKILHEHWNDFLKEIGITFGEANMMLEVARKDKYKLGGIPVRRIKKMYKYLNDLNSEELIDYANTLLLVDFHDELNKYKNKKSKLECRHDKSESYKKCKICGKWEKISDEENTYENTRQTMEPSSS